MATLATFYWRATSVLTTTIQPAFAGCEAQYAQRAEKTDARLRTAGALGVLAGLTTIQVGAVSGPVAPFVVGGGLALFAAGGAVAVVSDTNPRNGYRDVEMLLRELEFGARKRGPSARLARKFSTKMHVVEPEEIQAVVREADKQDLFCTGELWNRREVKKFIKAKLGLGRDLQLDAEDEAELAALNESGDLPEAALIAAKPESLTSESVDLTTADSIGAQ